MTYQTNRRTNKTPLSEGKFFEGNNYDSPKSGSIWGSPGELILSKLDIVCQPGETWFDIPSGDGRYTQEILTRIGKKGQYIAADADKNGLERLRKQQVTPQNKKQIHIVEADITDLPFDNNSTDGIFSISVLHFFSPKILRKKVFPGFIRILKPKGKILFNFSVDIVRTNLNTNEFLPFQEYQHKEKDVFHLVTSSFPDKFFILNYQIVRGLISIYENTDPPYRWEGTSIVFEVLKK